MNVWSCFKNEQIRQRSLQLHPIAFMILCDMLYWTKSRNLPFVISDTVTTETEDAELSRVSSTHREGRAFDISLKGWEPLDVDLFVTDFDIKYAKYAAMSKSGHPVLIVRHNAGTGDHLHVQINSAHKGGFDNP